MAGSYGTGADGNVTISGNTTLTADKNYNNLTVNGGVTLNTAGFIVRVLGTLTNNGIITDSSSGGTGGTGGTGAPRETTSNNNNDGGDGGNGGAPSKSGGGAGGHGGGGGGSGGSYNSVAYGGKGATGGAGGKGGGRVHVYAKALTNNGTIHADGFAGSNGLANKEDGGYYSWMVGKDELDDAAGGGGAGGGGGNGGNGGTVTLIYAVRTIGTVRANGGSGGSGSVGGAGRDTVYQYPGSIETDGGSGGSGGGTGGTGGRSETGADASGAGATGGNGSAGSAGSTGWTYESSIVSMTGTATVHASASAALSRGTTESMTGTATIHVSASAVLRRVVEMSGTTTVTASAQAVLSRGVTESLAGTSSTTASAQATISWGVSENMTGNAASHASASALLSRDIPITGTATVSASAQAVLGRGVTESMTGTATVHVSSSANLRYGYVGIAKHEISRTPVALVIIKADYCGETFGSGACTATGTKCYNTFKTCKDKANFNRTTKDYKFTSQNAPLPFKEGERPYVTNIDYAATEIKDNNITTSARVKIQFADDALETDIGIDPYVSTRASVQGTFWKKFLARNPNLRKRYVEVWDGFVGMPAVMFKKGSVGQICNITKAANAVTIEIEDLLKNLSEIDVPAEYEIQLPAEIDASITTIPVTDTASLASSGHVRLDDELITYTGKGTYTLTGCTRGAFGTTAVGHDSGANVQPARYYAPQNPFDILQEMLETDAGIDAGYINSDSFTAAKAWPGKEINFWGIISEPTKLSELFFEIIDLLDCKVWVAEDLKITIARNWPNYAGRLYHALSDQANIVEGSCTADLNEKSRFTRASIYCDKDAVGDLDKPASYARLDIAIDNDAESDDEYGDEVKKKFWSRWIHPDCGTEEAVNLFVSMAVRRWLANRRDAMPTFTLRTELKDGDIKTGEFVKLTTNALQDIDGNALADYRAQVVRRDRAGNIINMKVMAMPQRRVCIIAPSGTSDYGSATDAEKEYGFIGDAYCEMPNGDKAYTIL